MANYIKTSWFTKILLLCSMSMMLLFAVSIMVFIMGKVCSVTTVTIIGTVVQCLIVFILPVILLAFINKRLEGKPVASTMWMSKGPSFKSILLVVLVWMASLPAMNYVIAWNQSIDYPSWLKFLEDIEEAAAKSTELLLGAKSWGMMIVMVVVVGVLPGLSEEIFFRAGMLGTMRHGNVNRHVAIWVVAIIFSAIHFQFLGFVPRMLLGAWFGYLMVWRGEVWTPIIAHALNNGAVVVVTFLANRGLIADNFVETLGIDKPMMALGSLAATVLLIVVFMRKPGNRNKTELLQ